jgi:hypothetical protein
VPIKKVMVQVLNIHQSFIFNFVFAQSMLSCGVLESYKIHGIYVFEGLDVAKIQWLIFMCRY